MRFGVLGTLDVVEDDHPVAVRGILQRRLLGLLLSHPNRVVSAEALIEGLWNGAPPPSAAKTLQSHMVRLRDAVDPERKLLETRPPGYVLHADGGSLDALRFEQLVGRARRAGAAGVPESAAAMLADALGLWRGPAYADLRDCETLSVEAARLEEIRLGALEERIETDLALGHGPDLVPELEASVSEHPFRERLWRQLAVALYRSGRQADALAALARVRALLREELGVDPGPELRGVEAAILAHNPSLGPAGAAASATVLPPALDADTWPVIGRHAELNWLHDAWVEAARSRGGVVLVRGPAGIGRSRLLAELARDVSARGVSILYAAGRPDVDALADAIRNGGVSLATDATGSEVTAALRRAAEQVPTLVVLDDLHLAGDGPASLEPAAVAASGLPLLIVASYDSGAATPGLRRLAGRLDPVGRRTLELRPLPEEAVAEVVGRTVRDVDRREAADAAAAAGGHPRHLRLAVTQVVEDAAVRRLDEAAQDAEGARRGLVPARDALTSGVLDLRAAREGRTAATDRLPPEPVTCPYKGLARYDVADAEYFVGRERLTAQLVARVVEDDLVVIVGASGSGKSSVARAGLLAALADGVLPGSAHWRQVRLVPGSDPPAALRHALGGVTDDAAPLVVLVDQFEEIFTNCADEDRRRAFVAEVLALGRDREARVVLTLRADYYGHCAAYLDLAARLADNSVLVGPLTDAELARVVEIPARRAGLTVTPGLPDLVVADVGGQAGALPLLSTALLRTWEHRHGRVLSANSYREGGGIARAVERLGESAYDRLDPDAATAARRLLLRLADPGPTDGTLVRRRAPLAEVVADADGAAARALAVLTERRLVSVTDDTVEVAHEALFAAWPRLRAWLDEDAAGRRLVRHLSATAADWLAGGRDPAELYRGTRLQAGLDWAAVHGEDLTAREREFLDASAAEADRQRRETEERLVRERAARRRLLRVLTALAVVLVLAVAAAGIAANSRRDARDAARTARDAARVAEARRLGALGVITQDLDRALLLAVQAVRIDDAPETRGDLLATLLRSPAAVAVVRPPGGHRLLALDVAPDRRTVVVGDNAGHLLLVDTATRRIEVLARPAGDDETIQVAEFSADGRSLAALRSRGDTSAVELWDLATRTVSRVPGSAGSWGIGWSPAGRRLAIVKAEGDAVVVDLDDPDARRVRLVGSMGQYIGPVRWLGPGSVVIAPTGEPLGIWDAGTGRRIRSLDVGDEPPSVAGSPDGRTLALGMPTSEVRLYDASTLRRTAFLTGHRAAVNDIAFSADGRSLASAGDDREIILWDVGTATLRERLPGHAGRVTKAAWTRDGRSLWTTSLDGSLMSWDVAGRQRLAKRIAPPTGETVEWVSIDDAGRRTTAAFSNGTVRTWDVPAARSLYPPVRTGGESLTAVGLSPDGALFVSCGWDGRALLYRTSDGQLLGPLRGLSGEPVLDATFSPDGRTVAVSTLDGVLRLVDVASRRPTGRRIRPGAAVWSTVWSHDARTVLFTSEFTNDVTVWSVPQRRRLATLTPTGSPTLTAAYSPDGALLVTGGMDGRIRFWDPTEWRQVGGPVLMGAGFILSASFSPDGDHLVTSSDDGTIRLLDMATRKPLGPPMPGADNERAFARWVPGDRVVAGFGDGSVSSYDVDPDSWVQRACAVAGRQLTRQEWSDALPGRPYERTC